MKKILSAILAIAIVASLGVVSFAAPPVEHDENWLNTNGSKTQFTIGDLLNGDGDNVAVGDSGKATVEPGSTYYMDVRFILSNNEFDLMDKYPFKVSIKKGSDNAKNIQSLKLVEKSLGGATRQTYIAVEFNEVFNGDEFKVSPTIDVQLKQYLVADDGAGTNAVMQSEAPASDSGLHFIAPGVKLHLTATYWAQNSATGHDNVAGKGNSMITPDKNDDNEIIWSNNNHDIAQLNMAADNDPAKIYSKMKTEWVNDVYADQIGSADAFKLTWVANPKISSTSRAPLYIYNPFYDYNEDVSTVEIESINVYQDVDGVLVLANDKFEWVENDNGDTVLMTKVRELSNFVITDGTTVTDGATTEAPEGDKENPGTGR